MKFQYLLAFALVCGFAAGQGGEQEDILGTITKCVNEAVTTLSTEVQTCVDGDEGLKHIVDDIQTIVDKTGTAVGKVREAIEACGQQEDGDRVQCIINAFQGLKSEMEGVGECVKELAQTIQQTPVKDETKQCLQEAVETAKNQMEKCLGGAGETEQTPPQ